jgi:hypothetical protein
MVERYQAIMDCAPIDGPIDADAQREVREWLAKFRPATHAKPMPARALNRCWRLWR